MQHVMPEHSSVGVNCRSDSEEHHLRRDNDNEEQDVDVMDIFQAGGCEGEG